MVYLTGDMHGDTDISKFTTKNFPLGKTLTKDDYVIILGDFGLMWYQPTHKRYKGFQYWVNWLDQQPWTTLFVDGNHENFDLMDKLPEMDMFGGKVGKFTESMYHLKRGEVYTINDEKYWVMGGALSIDKDSNPHRIPNIGWWEREIPSNEEFEHGMKNLDKHDWNVDYVLTHTCPNIIGRMYIKSIKSIGYNDKLDTVSRYLDVVLEKIQFKKHYFGHFHDNWTTPDDKFVMLYKNIVPLGKNHKGE